MDNSKYYFAQRKGDQAYPSIQADNEGADLWKCSIASPRPRKPVMADFLDAHMAGAVNVFTKRIADVLQAMNMEGVNFHPSTIDDSKGTIYDNYVCVETGGNIYELADKKLLKY
jgi:hypothetical protein